MVRLQFCDDAQVERKRENEVEEEKEARKGRPFQDLPRSEPFNDMLRSTLV